jgi:hypothetical protein
MAAIALVVVLPAAAAAHAGHDHAGVYRINPDVGPALSTHGPDPVPPGGPRVLRTAGFDEGSPERQPLCAGSDRFQILYGHAADSPDRLAEMAPRIRASVRRMNAVLSEESVASGGLPADYRVACDTNGEIDIASFTSDGTSFEQVVSGARAAGFNSKSADYLIFFDGRWGGTCGIASYYDDQRLAPENRNNSGGGFGAIYDGCWFGETPMHEAGHLMGAVQYDAPHSTGNGGHCWEEADVMCYSPDGGDLHQFGTVLNCPGNAVFDCGYDDYFDAAPEPGEYLESNWNLGSPMNRYLSFGGAPPVGASPQPKAQWRKLRVRVPRRTKKLEVRLRGNQQIGLYLRHRHAPTENRFACRRPRGAHKVCRIRNPHRGRWVAAALRPADAAAKPIRIKANVRRDRSADGRKQRSKQRIWRPAF